MECLGIQTRKSVEETGSQEVATALCEQLFDGSGGDHQPRQAANPVFTAILLCLSMAWFGLSGCGSGGYPGIGIASLTATAITIDAGQSISVGASAGNMPVSWTLSGSSCSGSGCGSLSANTGTTVQYMAPSSVSTTFQVTLTAAVAGTSSTRTVTITVNPAPAIPGVAPTGTVGVPYTYTYTTAGGTSPIQLSLQSGSMPAGLSFNAATGAVSGTPTTAGSSSFTLQAVDASNVPYTVAANKTITIQSAGGSGGAIVVSSMLPTATVGSPYTGTIGVTGGTAPYGCAITTGTLPAGLTLGANCAVTGTPAAPGNSTVGVTITDSGNPPNTGTGQVSLTIAPAAVTITTGTLPAGTLNTPYSSTIAVMGGTAPYVCSLAGGTLPHGLTLNANCSVTGTPTTTGTQTVTVRGTDSGNPAQSGTGPVSITINATSLNLGTGTLPNGTVGAAYSGNVGVTGGTAPYMCNLAGGTLPAGLTLNANCTVSGTPTVAGTSSVSIHATDSSNPVQMVTSPETITIAAAPALTLSAPPSATVNQPYSGTVTVAGGSAPYTCTLVGGTLPAGLTLGTNCVITGTPTTTGSTTATVAATDSSQPARTTTGAVTVSVNPAPVALNVGNPASATVGTSYTGTIPVSGGAAPYTCTVAGGTLPAGLALGANCNVTGTPTTAGASTVQVTATDAANPAHTTMGASTITVNAAPVTLSIGNPASATVGTPYTGIIPVSGGTAPYTCSVAGGTLPAGLSLGANCSVTGTPTTAGTSTVQVTATDAANPAHTTTAAATLTVNATPVTLGIGNPASATVGTPYTGTIPVFGGTAPYSCTVAGGALPAGLTLGANCTLSGTPTTAGPSTVQVTATDAANPAHTTTAASTITVEAAPVTLGVGNPATATVGSPYSGTIPVAGGTAPYSCAVAGGTLPAGLALSANCTLSGTPTVAGPSTVQVTVTDSANPARTTTAPSTITVNAAPVTLSIGNPASATVGTPYTGSIPVTGGSAPYSCTVAGGALPAGLALGANCALTGTPTTAATSTVQITATDSANPAHTATAPSTITVEAAPVTLSVGNPATATVGTPYTGSIPVAGGTAPYNCTISSGTLPAGLALGANCAVTGTPTTAITSTVQVTATDSANPAHTTTAPSTITVESPAVPLAIGNPQIATVSTPYTGTIPVTGGTAPYSCTIVSGTLPAGLALGANCAIAGTPTTAGNATVQVTATDSSNPAKTLTGPATVTVQPVPTLTLTGSLPNAVVNQPYTQTLQANGGVGPYTYAVTAGALPAGMTLSSGGVVSGTPTTPGASSFTVTATDKEGTPQTANLPLVLLVTYAPTPNDALLNGPYAFLFQGYDDVAAGVLAYQTATAGSITADGNGTITAGEEDSNHQTSNPTGNTISTANVVGTYTVGTDNRGSLTLTRLDSNGTVGTTTTYAIALRAAVAPATTTAQGSLIEADGDQVVGTKGSGTLLAQTATAFTTGLNGSYAFGVSGDTPCLPTCTIGIAAGPVASVGQFQAANNTVTGVADTNIANINTASSALSGTYTTADTNGRVQLNLQNAKLAGVPFPTDYAAYVVDNNRVLLLSTDKHSAYILQAGTATLQTQANFSSNSLNAPFVGYENSPVNPGLLNVALQNTLNLSTATVFRGTGNGNGTCNTTNVDSSGTTGVVNGLGGLVNAPVINALLGSYQTLGSSNCAVTANGRVVYNYPESNAAAQLVLTGFGLPTTPAPRVVYLTAPNQGYFLETGYAGLGHIEAQTGSPYGNASLNGTYVFASIPASTLATVNSSGVFTADGNGNATSTVDRNVGVGTINVLNLGVTTPATYNITDTIAGRFFLNTGEVIYEIVPGRFVLLEPQAVNTSAYVALLF